MAEYLRPLGRDGGRGGFIQRLNARTIEREGTKIYLGSPTGRSVKAMIASLERRDRDYVPEGDGNAADADWSVFVVSPLSFPTTSGAPPESAWPKGSDVLFWHGDSYTVTGTRKVDSGASTTGLRVVAYRTPQPDAATVDPATGRRPDYTAPDATL